VPCANGGAAPEHARVHPGQGLLDLHDPFTCNVAPVAVGCCMSPGEPQGEHPQHGRAQFTTTHWSVVLVAGRGASSDASAALERLCQTYWYPLYAYVRRHGSSPEDAQDLTQGFCERLLEQDLLAELQLTGARFRSFLLHAFKNYLASEWTRAQTGKRGRTRTIPSLDELSPEVRYALEAADAMREVLLLSGSGITR
jgi:hypothetical protein